MTNAQYPLANDPGGNRIEVPPEAAAWRVRRGGGRPGRPRVIFDGETGRQLEVPLAATVNDLIEKGLPPGRYRLEGIDADGNVIPEVVAVTEISVDAWKAMQDAEEQGDAPAAAPAEAATTAAPAATVDVLQQQTMAFLEREKLLMKAATDRDATILKMAETLCGGFQSMVGAFAPLRPTGPIVVESSGGKGDEGIKPEKLLEYLQLGGSFFKSFMESWNANKPSAEATAQAAAEAGSAE